MRVMRDTLPEMKLHQRANGVYCRVRASSEECRSSQHPQRGLIQTDPPLWVGSYYRRSLLSTREDRHRASYPAPHKALFRALF
nr:hypothetical protein MFLOJ_18280 [Mycobacterium florentinum]